LKKQHISNPGGQRQVIVGDSGSFMRAAFSKKLTIDDQVAKAGALLQD
jgi:hypothetical protein